MQWPLQSDVLNFYGDPRGKGGAIVSENWRRVNLVMLKPPFKMAMGPTPIRAFPVHRKCRDACAAWLGTVWDNAGRNQKIIDDWGMSVFSGSFAYRPMRGQAALSMHAYGCALDFDAPRNAFHDSTPHFAVLREEVVKPFLKLGGVWGGDWKGRSCDGMHFQFARVR